MVWSPSPATAARQIESWAHYWHREQVKRIGPSHSSRVLLTDNGLTTDSEAYGVPDVLQAAKVDTASPEVNTGP